MSQAPQLTDLQLALQDVDIAFRQLEFAIKLLTHCELGKIDADDFDTDHSAQLAQGTISFPKGPFSDQASLVRGASIGVLIAFAATSLVLDTAFQVAGINPSLHSQDNTVRLRTLVSMVRNCMAHGLAAPAWRVNAQFHGLFTVTAGNVAISLDIAALNGQPFDVDQIGGYPAWYSVRDAALAILTQ